MGIWLLKADIEWVELMDSTANVKRVRPKKDKMQRKG